MKNFKKTITLTAAATLCMMLLCLTPVYAAERPISVYLNGNLVEFDITNGVRDQALTIYDYAYVPIARIVELLTGSRPVWDDYSKTSTYNYNGKRYVIDTRQNGIYVDGAFIPSVTGTPPVIQNDRMMIPLKMISATMGFSQNYVAATHSTWLSSPVSTPAPQPVYTPIPVVTQPQIPVAITSSELNKTTASVGESITVTVKTTKSANNVWINDGIATYEAIYAWEDAAGIKTWVYNYKVTTSATLSISANTSRNASGAVTSSLTVTVSTPVPTASPTPTPIPGTYSGIIQSVVPNKTTINPNEAVTLTIRTTSTANVVWINYNNTTATITNAALDLTGIKTWTTTIYPSASQQIQIWANTTQTTANASTVTQYINVYGSSSSYVTISSVYTNPQTVSSSQPITLTVITNSAAMNVWSSSDNLTFSNNSGTDLNGNKTWTATLYPTSSRTVTINAGRSSGSIEATQQVYVNVTGTSSTNPEISAAYATPGYVPLDRNTMITNKFNITTNSIVSRVEVIHNDVVYSSSIYSYSGNDRTWEVSVSMRWSGASNGSSGYERVTIRAVTDSGQTTSVTRELYVQ